MHDVFIPTEARIHTNGLLRAVSEHALEARYQFHVGHVEEHQIERVDATCLSGALLPFLIKF